VLDYLARYVFRVAITNTRIVGLDDQAVTIRHKHRKSNRWRTSRIPGHEFMRRFLQHVLPKGLHKVRYFGLWHHTRREQAAQARLLLQLDRPATSGTAVAASPTASHARPDGLRTCPRCHEGHLVRIRRLSPQKACGP
jgi:cytochrome c553